MSRPLTKRHQAYKRQLATLYAPVTEALHPYSVPQTPSPADTTARLEHIQHLLELGEITRAQDLIGQLIDGYKS